MTGVIAAVATPVGADGGLVVATFERLVGFLLESGVDGLCLGGATSEYPNTALEDRKAAIGAAARHLPLDRKPLVAIGASSLRQSLELGESARDAGSRAVLLPMPMFFRYAQHDLEAFSIEVSRTLRLPVLLYDLPDFTNALEPDTVIRLLQNEGLIVGIKDSSGMVGNLVCYATARGNRGWTLLVGNDRLLLTGLKAGWKRIRLCLIVLQLRDSGVLGDQESAVIAFEQRVDSLRRIRHGIELGWTRLPSPQAIHPSRPEIASAILI